MVFAPSVLDHLLLISKLLSRGKCCLEVAGVSSIAILYIAIMGMRFESSGSIDIAVFGDDWDGQVRKKPIIS